ncbi:fimbrial protein [Vibrio chagasii]|uniref:fimbrial protein n=1 Tax=Vibrio chagasii TaxID=170679 RepID=UPI001EFDE326|nr:fimbrial protein [Vibrio chagasii]MCG9604098.1 fimbrial protein [Vibrio chagasii]
MYISILCSSFMVFLLCGLSFVAYSGNPSYLFVDVPDHTTLSLSHLKYVNYWRDNESNHRFDSLTINDDSRADSTYHAEDGVSVWFLKDKEDKALSFMNDKVKTGIYPTEHKGIGYVIEVKSQGEIWKGIGESGQRKLSSRVLSQGFAPYLRLGAYWRVGFVFKDYIKPGEYHVNQRKVGELRLSKMKDSLEKNTLGFFIPLYYSEFSFKVTTNTCDFDDVSTVLLPRVNFGSRSSNHVNFEATPFNIKFRCPKDAQVIHTISDANTPFNTSNVLNTDTGFGVGLQLYIRDISRPIDLDESRLDLTPIGDKNGIEEYELNLAASYVHSSWDGGASVVAYDAIVNLNYN